MASSTTTTLNDFTNAGVTQLLMLDYPHDWSVAQQFFGRKDVSGMPGNRADFPVLASDMGTVGDNGSGVDTEFDGTEDTDLTAVALDSDVVQISCSEYALMRTITDNVYEDSIAGIDVLNVTIADASRILFTALEKDCWTLFASLSNTVGVSGADLTIAQMLAAEVNIATRGNRAQDGVVYCLDDQAVNDLQAALMSTNSATAVFASTADRLIGVDATANNGHGNGHVMNFRQYGVYRSGLADTANSTADVVSAAFTPASPGNAGFVTFGLLEKRPFRVEEQRDASLRAGELVFSMRMGAGEWRDSSGTGIVTDA